MWAGLVDPLAEPGRLELFGELALLRHRRDRTAGWCPGLLEHSALCRLVRTAALASLDRQSAALERDLADVRGDGRSLERFGPPYSTRGEPEVYADMAGHWARCSVLMADLCRARGVRYVQVLAPNQYVAGSKPMRRAERDAVYHPSTGYGPFLAAGYSHLIAEGRTLAARGVPFHDLTGIFRNTEEPTYIDDCCHLNALGNAILGKAIARAIVADLGTAAP